MRMALMFNVIKKIQKSLCTLNNKMDWKVVCGQVPVDTSSTSKHTVDEPQLGSGCPSWKFSNLHGLWIKGLSAFKRMRSCRCWHTYSYVYVNNKIDIHFSVTDVIVAPQKRKHGTFYRNIFFNVSLCCLNSVKIINFSPNFHLGISVLLK